MTPEIPLSPAFNLSDFEALAREKMTHSAFEYFYGGAGDEITIRENRTAFDRIRLRPRMMVDVTERDLSVSVLGQRLNVPFMVAPMAVAKLAHPDGELAVARAANTCGIGIVHSTQATCRMEDVITETTAPMWYQLYVYKERDFTRDLVQRAEACGYQALVITVDVPYLGRRERDLRSNFSMPPGMNLANLNLPDRPRTAEVAGSGMARRLVPRYDTTLTWRDLEWFRSITKLPVLIKGIVRGDDAALAVQHGAQGIIVSNHGGRQLDSVMPSIEALPEVVEAVQGRADVLMDGGVRRGIDILKAQALGAKAVLVGRPVYFALAAGGEASVQMAFELLRDEYDLAMALCGCRSFAEITPDLVHLPKS